MNQLLGVIGDPIEHSLSPLMHNHWYKELGLDCYYHPFHLSKETLEDGVRGFRTLGFRGFNVTIPHKVEIISKLDGLDEEAKLLGAVNTVVNDNGYLTGFNTDGRGLVSAVQEVWPNVLKDASVLIIGAGGASYGVALTFGRFGAKRVDIANRTFDKASDLSVKCERFVPSGAFTIKEAAARLDQYSFIINSTPIGMSPSWLDQMPIQLDNLKSRTICIDLIYNPLKTRWLKEAENHGAQIMNGLPMLVHQGALSFEHWFGVKPNTKSMIKHLTDYLEEKHVNR